MNAIATKVVRRRTGRGVHADAVEAGHEVLASTLDDVDALVIPEQTTAKATMKVTKWMPKALCV